MSESGLSKYQDELLVILQEECGETVQEICKIIRFGYTEESQHITGMRHVDCLQQELGDILALIELVRDANIGITEEGLRSAIDAKKAKLTKYMRYKNPEKRSSVSVRSNKIT